MIQHGENAPIGTAPTGPNILRSCVARTATLLTASLCVIVALLSGCKKQPPPPAPVPVVTKTLVPEKIELSRRFSGSIEPLQTTTLAFKLSGTVRSLHRPPGLDRDVQVGDTLAKGTVIAELDEGDLRRAKMGAEARVAQLEARVVTARETLAIATRNLERFDNSAGSVSKVARDEVEARRVAAAGELEAADHALADARIQLDQAIDDYANRLLVVPFDHATIAEKHIEPGERKAAHELAFRLIDISTVYVNFGVPDTMIGNPAVISSVERVFLGQRLPVTADAFEGRTLTGTVTKIAPQADARTRTFLTQLTLVNQEIGPGQPMLRPGMIVTVRVGAENDREVMLLPMAAIHQGRSPDDLMVYEVTSETGGAPGGSGVRDVVRQRKISLGGIYNNQVEVLPAGSEVRAGSRVVVSTAERLADGVLVRLRQENVGPATTQAEAGK
ncbi:MAG: efflux RND transporter periplasmic adaptor subunit [Phycisphaerales bacterium]|nr:efflux RND transporter periplasmic adaptor subunit [Phycisphaerales bacterium]